MNSAESSPECYVPKSTLACIVVYEDFETRQRAMTVCDDLVKQFWPDIRFKFDWWHVNFLQDEGIAELAVRSAARSDLLIYCGAPNREFSVATKRWFQRWSQRRSTHGGALVDLTEISGSREGAAELKKIFLRDIASRAFMDYVTRPPVAAMRLTRERAQQRQTDPVQLISSSATTRRN